jgi:hypothetical protein
VCPTDGQCFNKRNVIIFELDMEQNTQAIISQKPVAPVYNFQLGETASSDLDSDPTRVPFQGLSFSKGKYITSLNSPIIGIPQIFTVEAWVRFDLDYPGAYGDLQYIYEVTRND